MRVTRLRCLPWVLCAALIAAATSAYAQAPAVRGYWRTPSGGIIRIAPCGHELCVDIAQLPPGNHPLTDTRNRDAKLRQRPLCGLRIGTGFVEVDPQDARGGHLYDPRSGHTYSGQMTAEGNLLRLRGYIGLPVFGRTETWVRASKPPPCPPNNRRISAAPPISERPWNCLAGGTYTRNSLNAGESYEQGYGSKKAGQEEAGQDLRREARGEARETAG